MNFRLMGLFMIALISLNGACEGPEETKSAKMPSMEERIETNKLMMQQENQRIDGFIKRREWPMQKSSTGLRYWVYDSVPGRKAEGGMLARVDFDISLLDGTMCYSTDSAGPQVFRIDMDHVESGLHEGIKYLRVGEKAKLILPPHLAHGLIGDREKIPMHSTIVYDIQLLDLKSP